MVVVDTFHSPYARLRPVPLPDVTLNVSVWAPRLRTNRVVTLPAQHRLLEETGRLTNFRRAAGKVRDAYHGYFFNDSDVYKWIEAVAWTAASGPAPELTRLAEPVIAEIEAAQQPDGYLDTYFMFDKAAERWSNLRDMHELYCAGHLIQAAIAHHRATGHERLLAVARRTANLICATFGPESAGKRPGACGHPEIELALVELARETSDEKYLLQAQYFIDARGYGLVGRRDYHQDHQPLRERGRMAGHAVRALYLNAGAADVAAEKEEPELRLALERMWEHMVARQLYLTGSAGSRHQGESFGADYELPNARAYAETCAAIAVVMWAWRMLALSGDARYTDVMEAALYNGFLSGVSLDGQAYFYVNPLASDGSHRRQSWYECACCPPNVARTLASLPAYLYSTDAASVWVHLYAAGDARMLLADGRSVRLHQRTRYPWDGDVELEIDAEREFALFLRIPGWCEAGASLMVNGHPFNSALTPGSYAGIQREWHTGDTVQLHLPMPVRRVMSHPRVAENHGRVALMRGPLLYCLEGVDHPATDLRDIVLPVRSQLTPAFQPDLLGGVVTLTGTAVAVPPHASWQGRLYRTEPVADVAPPRPLSMTAIPYYAWANREPGAMQVWLQAAQPA
jgi:DUF1680 family protein